MMTVQTFEINHRLPGMNDMVTAAKKHWAAYSEMKKGFTDSVCAQALDANLNPVEFCILKILWKESSKGHKRDIDNVSAVKKFILDGLVKAGVIPDDSPTYIQEIREKFVYDPSPGVEITIIGGHS